MNSKIQKEDGRYYLQDDAGLIAEMTYSNAGDAMMIIDGTYVRDSHRGQGLGVLLLESLLAQAEAEGRKVVPLCPFVKAQFDRNEKYRAYAVS